jgi:hypothetical protein
MIIVGRKNITNDPDFEKFQEMVISLANYSFIDGPYISDDDMENIRLMMSTYEFINILSEANEEDSDGYYFMSKYSGNSDWTSSIDSYEIRSTLDDKDFLRDDEDDEKIFDKFYNLIQSNTDDIEVTDVKGLDFSDIANMIERQMVMMDSQDLSRLRMLAGIK